MNQPETDARYSPKEQLVVRLRAHTLLERCSRDTAISVRTDLIQTESRTRTFSRLELRSNCRPDPGLGRVGQVGGAVVDDVELRRTLPLDAAQGPIKCSAGRTRTYNQWIDRSLLLKSEPFCYLAFCHPRAALRQTVANYPDLMIPIRESHKTTERLTSIRPFQILRIQDVLIQIALISEHNPVGRGSRRDSCRHFQT